MCKVSFEGETVRLTDFNKYQDEILEMYSPRCSDDGHKYFPPTATQYYTSSSQNPANASSVLALMIGAEHDSKANTNWVYSYAVKNPLLPALGARSHEIIYGTAVGFVCAAGLGMTERELR